MKKTCILLTIVSVVGNKSVLLLTSDVGLMPLQMIENHGYVSEIHYITTEDGYILTYYRIPHGFNEFGRTKRPAVLIEHGVIGSAADFVNMGSNRSLAYILADSGYDVWLGNARGNEFSRNHTTLDVNINKKEFFDFTWHEIGYYDYAAAIDYILNLNGDDSLYYVGLSRGTTSFFVLMSTRPEYNKKIKVAHMLAPVTHMAHYSNNIIKTLVNYIDQIEDLLFSLGIYELPFTELIRSSATKICVNPGYYIFCDLALVMLHISDLTQFDSDKTAVITTNSPSNNAIKEILHYGQLIKSGKFAQYDYGTKKNLIIYGTETPPEYDLSKVTSPVALYYAINDGIQDPEDVRTLKSLLSNVAEDYVVPWGPFNHYDFLFARDVVKLVYNKLLAVNKRYSY